MARTKTTRRSATKASANDLGSLDLTGGPLLVERFRADATALPASSVRPLHGSARLMCVNTAQGVESVVAERSRLAKELPRFNLAAATALPELALATAWAAEEVVRFSDENPANIRALLKRAGELRLLLLTSLDSAARAGLVPSAQLKKLRAGRGGFDTAGDCVAAAGLFRKHAAALKGKTPVTAAHVKEAEALGARLLAVLQPKGARKKGKGAALKAALDLRNRLGTLLAQRYTELRRAGGWLFGEERDAKVPMLLANAGRAKRKAPAAAPVEPTK